MKNRFTYRYITAAIMTIIAFALSSCETETKVGFLSLDNARLSVDEEIIPLSRLVDNRLRIQIVRGDNEVVKDFAPNTDLAKRISIPVGIYTLKAYTDNRAKEADNNVLGEPIYESETQVEIVENDITRVSLVVPQTNVSVKFVVSDAVKALFRNISVTVSSESGRSYSFANIESASEICYFLTPANKQLTYVVNAVNTDGESFSATKILTIGDKLNNVVNIAL